MSSTAKSRTIQTLLAAAYSADRRGDTVSAMMLKEQAKEADECLVHRPHRKREWADAPESEGGEDARSS